MEPVRVGSHMISLGVINSVADFEQEADKTGYNPVTAMTAPAAEA